MRTLVYIHDQFVDGTKAHISALDLSVLRGFGVMDYLRTYGGRPFRLKEHLERFIFSAEEVGLKVPKSIKDMEAIVEALLRKASFEETSVKLMLTGGVSEDQLMPEGAPVFFAVAYPFKPFPKVYFKEGIKMTTACYQRSFPKAKTIQYLPAIVALKQSAKKGAVDVLFHNEQGFLLETGTANFFALKEGEFITPKEGILEGITRKVILELEAVKQRPIHKSEIKSFDGLFLASSNKEIMPVIQIDNHIINNSVIPLRIQDLMKRFKHHTKPAALFS
ncbi:MAG: aminotransferase class IV [Simkaniaceae bacterium]|nr:aminotransferase class IV [Simkaniaceae bacterium]